MGFDAWLKGDAGTVSLTTNHGELSADLSDIGLEETTLEAGGLERKLKAFRLPDAGLKKEMRFTRAITLESGLDNPIWVCVTTEDGFQAWSSPVYLFDGE